MILGQHSLRQPQPHPPHPHGCHRHHAPLQSL